MLHTWRLLFKVMAFSTLPEVEQSVQKSPRPSTRPFVPWCQNHFLSPSHHNGATQGNGMSNMGGAWLKKSIRLSTLQYRPTPKNSGRNILRRWWLWFYDLLTYCVCVLIALFYNYFVHNVSATVCYYSPRTGGKLFLQWVRREGFTSEARQGPHHSQDKETEL